MSTKRYKPEEIVNLLRQVEVAIGNGKRTPQACQRVGIAAHAVQRQTVERKLGSSTYITAEFC